MVPCYRHYIYYYEIKNRGNTPILPQDFIEPISFSVEEPWTIYILGRDEFEWKADRPKVDLEKINRQTYRIKPTLFNPGDLVWVNIYVGTTKKISSKTGKKPDEPKPKWSGRIINVKSILEDQRVADRRPTTYLLTYVYLSGWDVYWFVATTALLFIFAIWMSSYTKRIAIERKSQLTLLVLIMLFSMSTAEIIVYLFTQPHGLLWTGCWILIFLHVIILLYILWPLIKGKILRQ